MLEVEEEEVDQLSDSIDHELLFCYPPSEVQALPSASVSTPGVRSAIKELIYELGYIPSDAQVAQRLNLRVYGYRKFREYTGEVAAGMFFARQRNGSGGKETLHLLGPEDDPLYHCVRSEMQALLIDAIAHLAGFSHLYLSFYYKEDWLSASLRVAVDVADHSDSEVRATAYASAQARIVDREHLTYGFMRRRWESDPFSPHCRSWMTVADKNSWKPAEPEFSVTGYHTGWRPTQSSRKILGRTDRWDRYFVSWCCINEQEELTRRRWEERYTVRCEE